MKHRKMIFLAAGLFALSACGAGATGSGGSASTPITSGVALPAGANALLTVNVASPSAAALSLETAAGPAEISSAFLGLREIELKTSSEGDDSGETELKGPFVVDLNALTVQNLGSSNIDDDADDDGSRDDSDTDDDSDGTPDSADMDDDGDGVPDSEDHVMGESEIVDAIALPPGTYTEIEAKLAKVTAEDSIDPSHPLAGKSVYLEGTLNGQAFVISGDFDAKFEVENSAGIAVTDGSIASFVLTFDPAAWFDGIDISTAEKDAGGVILLDAEHNATLFEQFQANLAHSAKMESDDDHDGIGDDSEGHDDGDDHGGDVSDDIGGSDDGSDHDVGDDHGGDDAEDDSGSV
ncbi:MAG TPA: hypothetical protein VFX30_03605 [bacterium]|nr:hypothetical protein [bacterium]